MKQRIEINSGLQILYSILDTDTRNCSTVQVEMTMTQFFNISCAAPPSDNDPCVFLLNKEIFGMVCNYCSSSY